MSNPFDAALPEQVLAAALAGKSDALEWIYRTYSGAVYTLARRMCGDSDCAHDITHDAFLRAFGRLGQFRGDAPFGRWLRSITANETLMRLRDARRLFSSLDPAMVDDGAPDVASLSNVDLEHALARLAPTPRAILWLYHVEGYSHAEIATLSGRTASFSKSQLSRAHRKLREIFAGEAAREPSVRGALPRSAL